MINMHQIPYSRVAGMMTVGFCNNQMKENNRVSTLL
jgi:hypothetical protein